MPSKSGAMQVRRWVHQYQSNRDTLLSNAQYNNHYSKAFKEKVVQEYLAGKMSLPSLANKYGKTNAQIILRWHIQMGHIIFPKTTNPEHMKENFDIFDFNLTDEEMSDIHNLNKNLRFFTMTLKEQEAHLSQFVPAD